VSAFCTVTINLDRYKEAENFLTRMPFEMRSNIIGKALKAAAAPVVRYAKALAPDSVKTGSRLLWSRKTAAQRSGKPQLSETVIVKSVSYRTVDAVVIGPSWPAGNIINVIGHPHNQVLWGRPTGRNVRANQFLQNAAQLTASEQGTAFSNTFAAAFDRFLRSQAKAIGGVI
jgi:hypothetical protein